DQAAYHVILQSHFLYAVAAESQHIELVCSQVLNPQFIGNGGVSQRLQFQSEWLVSGLHFTSRYYENAWYVDGLPRDKLDRLGDNGGNVRLIQNIFHLQLSWSSLFLDSQDYGGLNFRVSQIIH